MYQVEVGVGDKDRNRDTIVGVIVIWIGREIFSKFKLLTFPVLRIRTQGAYSGSSRKMSLKTFSSGSDYTTLTMINPWSLPESPLSLNHRISCSKISSQLFVDFILLPSISLRNILLSLQISKLRSVVNHFGFDRNGNMVEFCVQSFSWNALSSTFYLPCSSVSLRW